jgi:hypothetical protein
MRNGAIRSKPVKTSWSLKLVDETHQPIYLWCRRLRHRSNLMAKVGYGVHQRSSGRRKAVKNNEHLPNKKRTIAAPQKTTKNP